MKDEKYKPASKRQYKRLAQLVRLTGLGVNITGAITGHRMTVLLNWFIFSLKLGRGQRLPPLGG